MIALVLPAPPSCKPFWLFDFVPWRKVTSFGPSTAPCGRTTAPVGMALGHEITGEIVEIGKDVEYLKIGDIASVPFNVACGRCRTAARET